MSQVEHTPGHEVVTPLQMTCPLSLEAQLRSTAVQVPEPEQVTVPVAQVAVAVQADFSTPGFWVAAKNIPLSRMAQDSLKGGGLKIAARTSFERGARLGVWAKPANEPKKRTQATIPNFFMISSLGFN